LNEHPSRAEISALLQDDLASDRRIEIFLHLLRPCEECFAQAPLQIRVLLGFDGKPEDAAQEAADREVAIDRALQVALRHEKHLKRQRKEAKKAEKILAQGGMEAAENLPIEIGNLAAMEALLARSWAARHEDPKLMAQLAFFAVKRAEKLDAKRYGIQRVYDFRCRAEGELGNAYRVNDWLDTASTTLGQARHFFELGTGSESLDVRLLCLEASLDADLRELNSACVRLTKAYKIYLKLGDRHHAGRTLVKKGLYTSDAGHDKEALDLLKKSLTLIDAQKDPTLIFAANLNILMILVDLGDLDAARKQLFLIRPLQPHAGGQINKLRLRWIEARIDRGFGRFKRAESAFREVSEAFLRFNRGYDSALTSLDLAAVHLAQKKGREATEVVTAAYRVFSSLGIQREALLTLSFLRTACQVRMATQEMVEDIARYLRRLQNDPKAQYEGRR
jgi:tetratricopeptide (TPR) repeat protein